MIDDVLSNRPFFILLWLDLIICCGLLTRLYLKRRLAPGSKERRRDKRSICLAFFHPYCDAGGGGERVLWTAISTFQAKYSDSKIVVYTGDINVTKDAILNKVASRFSIHLKPDLLSIIHLRKRHLVEDKTWPRFTLLGQSLGSILLGFEALENAEPDIFIDTMGYAFTYPLVKAMTGASVISYTHYPVITTTMIQRIRSRRAGHTNSARVASSFVLSLGKLIYYTIFRTIYAWCLSHADVLMTNSTWTQHRILEIMEYDDNSRALRCYPQVVYPPCDVSELVKLPLVGRSNLILSIAQFRPEKEHATQIRALANVYDKHALAARDKQVRLVLAGSVRDGSDEARVAGLKELAQELGIADKVDFVINAPFSDLLQLLSQASIGLSTMIDEHFGINVVELMAAGVIVVAHPSAGPLLDIVIPFHEKPTGFHAQTADAFASRIAEVLQMSSADQLAIRSNARESAVERFSADLFERRWLDITRHLVDHKLD